MDNGLPIACGMERGFATTTAGRKPERERERVVMISSHPDWKADILPEEIPAGPVDLVRIFHEVLERSRRGPVLNMDDDAVTVAQMLDKAWRQLSHEDAPVRLSQMLRAARTERAAICLQLALLELLRLDAIVLRQERVLGDIVVRKNVAFE